MKFINILILLIICFTLMACPDKPNPKPDNPTPDPTIVPKDPVVKTFHLNYTTDKNWSLCGQRDYVVFDMFETTAAEFKKCSDMGATMICYFSSQYENWRPDADQFGNLGSKLDDWAGEKWVDPSDPKNLEVMYKRLDVALQRGCKVIDLDNVDKSGHETYILNIYKKAREKGLLVSQKNNVERVKAWYNYVDMYQNEQCQQYTECDVYKTVGRPVFNIEYRSSVCKGKSFMFSVVKDVNKMDKNFTICN